MRKTKGIFAVWGSFEKPDFLPITYKKSWLYNINSDKILNTKC